MSSCESLPPILPERPLVLILGSMPGEASLRRSQYYAHPRNAFWPIMASVLGFDPGLPYSSRVELLQASGVALWDVLRQCERRGSLDSAIVASSEQPNPIAELLDARTEIGLVIHNGKKSAQSFDRHVDPLLSPAVRSRIARMQLPSTSPAHAALSLEDKLARWEQAIRGALGGSAPGTARARAVTFS